MPTLFVQNNSIGAGNRITGVAATDYVILAGVTVGSTDTTAFSSAFGHRITVEGAIIGAFRGIATGANSTETLISIGNNGLVQGMQADGIFATGNVTITNHGRILGMAGDGVNVIGVDRFMLVNHGLIEGAGTQGGDGIILSSNEAGAVVINHGVIGAADRAFDANSLAYSGASIGQDQVWNYGTIYGGVLLRGGNDFYDGQLGRIINLGAGGRGLLLAGDGQDLVIGGLLGEEFQGEAGADILQGRGGDDILNGGLDNDQLFGGDGSDSLVGGGSNDYLDGQGEDDEVYGGDNNDTLFGNHGNDYLDGQGENDLIFGGDGNDIIRGNIGQDQMVGGAGSDTMTGGVGDDQFRFFASDLENGRRDVITDFAEAGGNADLLVFFDGIQASNITTSQAGGDTIVRITFAGGTAVHEIVVENFLVAQLADQIFFL